MIDKLSYVAMIMICFNCWSSVALHGLLGVLVGAVAIASLCLQGLASLRCHIVVMEPYKPLDPSSLAQTPPKDLLGATPYKSMEHSSLAQTPPKDLLGGTPPSGESQTGSSANSQVGMQLPPSAILYYLWTRPVATENKLSLQVV